MVLLPHSTLSALQDPLATQAMPIWEQIIGDLDGAANHSVAEVEVSVSLMSG